MQKKLNFKLLLVILLSLACLPAASSYATCPEDIFFYMKLDEATPAGPNGTYTDFIKDNDGTGDVNPTAVTGIINGAQEFNGLDTRINVPADNSFDWQFNESFSIEYWVKTDSGIPTNNKVIIGRDDSSSNLHWWSGIHKDDGLVSFVLRDKNGNGVALGGVGTIVLADGNWHHVVAVRDNSTDENIVYVDGVEQARADFDYSAGFDSAAAAVNIGWLANFSAAFQFDGMIDEVALYDRALTESEIVAHYANRSPQEGYCGGTAPYVPFPADTISLWKLEETPAAPNAVYEDDFDTNNGTGQVNPTAVAGQIGGAQQFNGSDTRINVPADNSFDWQFNESFSIEYWVKTDSGIPTDNKVVIGRDSGSGLRWWSGLHGGDGLVSFTLRDKNGNGVALGGVGTIALADGGWHHVVAVRDNSTDENIVYVDGVEQGRTDFDYPAGFDSATAALNIGWLSNFPAAQQFDGIIDEVALYDRALPLAEIQTHYAAGLAGTGVEAAHPAPVAVADADPTTVKELTEVTLDGTGSTDGDNNIASYLWEQTAGTPTVTITDATTATATFTPPDVAADTTLTFQLTVTDADGQSDTDTIQVNVVNRIPPTADAGTNLNVREGDAVNLDGSGSSDTDGTIAAYAWAQTGGTSVTLTGADTATPSFTAPNVAPAGETLTFQLTVTDDDGLTSAPDTVSVTVNDIANPGVNPTAVAGNNQTVSEGTAVTLDGSGSSDADGTIAAYSWTQTVGTSVTLTGADTATPSFTAPPVAAAGETLTFELTVTDNDGLTSTDSVDIIITNATANPVAAAGADQTVSEGDPVTLDGSGSSDADGTIESFAWVQKAGTTVTLTDAGTATPSFTAPEVAAAGETLTFELTVTDNDGLTSTDTVDVNVDDLSVPNADAGDDQTVAEGSLVTLDGSGSTDADGTIESFAWTQTEGTEVTISGADTPSPSFTAPQVDAAGETLTFVLTVTDNDGKASSDVVDIIVNDITVPIADAGPDQEVREASPVTLDGSNSSDEDGTIESYLWEQLAGTTVTLTGADTATASFTAPFVGSSGETLTFRLTVTDNEGNSASDTTDVTVSNTNHSNNSGCFISTLF